MDTAQLDKDELREIINVQQEKIAALEEQLRLAALKKYGKKSEKTDYDHPDMFADLLPDIESEETPEPDCIEVSTHKRGKRSKLSKDLPTKQVHYYLSDNELTCQCGSCLTEIKSTISTKQYDYVPAKVTVIEHVQHKYACQSCKNNIKVAPKEPQPIPKSNASVNLLAQIVTARCVDGLPFARQEKQWQRLGINIKRNTMSRWAIALAQLSTPLINLFEDAIRSGPVIHCDETPQQVNKEPGREVNQKSYMWVRLGGKHNRQVVLYHYDQSRSGATARSLMADYKGYVQCDRYSAYNGLELQGITLVGCFAHVRRKFNEALKACHKKEIQQRTKAYQALGIIKELYKIEKEIKTLNPHEKKLKRQELSIPILNKLKAWLDQQEKTVLPKSLLGKAIGYTQRQWKKLIRYCDCGDLDIDNNRDERAIRPFAIGRRAWLFSDTPAGAHANATLYSLTETAKLHGWEPSEYLKRIFKELPKAQCAEDFEKLMPWVKDDDNIVDALVKC